MSGTEFKRLQNRHALVAGGSLGGLLAGNPLRSAGWDVGVCGPSDYHLGHSLERVSQGAFPVKPCSPLTTHRPGNG